MEADTQPMTIVFADDEEPKIDAMQFVSITNEHWSLLAFEMLKRVEEGLSPEERKAVEAFINLASEQVEQTQKEMMMANQLPPEKIFKGMLAAERELLNETNA